MIPIVNNAFQFASIIHWISLAILSVFFTEVSVCLPLSQHKNGLTTDAAGCRLMLCCAVCGATEVYWQTHYNINDTEITNSLFHRIN